jgi:hypothetical protein
MFQRLIVISTEGRNLTGAGVGFLVAEFTPPKAGLLEMTAL